MKLTKENDMGLYINRDELMELYADVDGLDISNYDVKVAVIRQNILDMPTIDIVRCGECDKGEETISGKIRCKIETGYLLWEPTDFCSYGERRADD